MKIFIVSFFLGCVALSAYPQSKLAGAGKASKVGASTTKTPSKKTTSPKPIPSPKNSNNRTTPSVKVDPDAKYEPTGYMEISGISFANIDKDNHIIDDYGNNLYASEIKYLKPKMFYKGLASEEKEITVDVKIIKEDGSIETGKNSPDGYTYSYKFNVESGPGKSIGLSGWGRNGGGAYTAGQYKLEVWYKGNILFQKGIRLYSGSAPLATSELIKINNVTFSNQDKNGNTITSFGEELYENELKYLTPKIYYEGLYSNEQTVTLYYRIFESTGNLSSGTSSPLGFTSKQSITIKPGSNSLTLNGWGSESGGSFPSGVTKVEYWLDGEKIYETRVTVKKKEGTATFLTVDSKTAVSTSFSATGGTETFYVKTDADSWETWGIPLWCEIKSKTSSSFTLSCKPNSGSARNDYMKVKAGGKEVRIDISQK